MVECSIFFQNTKTSLFLNIRVNLFIDTMNVLRNATSHVRIHTISSGVEGWGVLESVSYPHPYGSAHATHLLTSPSEVVYQIVFKHVPAIVWNLRKHLTLLDRFIAKLHTFGYNNHHEYISEITYIGRVLLKEVFKNGSPF